MIGAGVLPPSTLPFMEVDPSNPMAFHHQPELCHFLASTLNPAAPEAAVAGLAAAGLDVDPPAALAWLGAAIGATSAAPNPETGALDWCVPALH